MCTVKRILPIKTTQKLSRLKKVFVEIRMDARNEKNHIYKGNYSGWYCVSDETFLSDKDLVEKTNAAGVPVKVSIESGHEVEWTEEINYKFRLSNFQADLKHWLKDGTFIYLSITYIKHSDLTYIKSLKIQCN